MTIMRQSLLYAIDEKPCFLSKMTALQKNKNKTDYKGVYNIMNEQDTQKKYVSQC